MLRTAILDDYQNVALKMADWRPLEGKARLTAFHDHIDDRDEDRLVERLSPFECIVVMRERTALRRSVLQRLPALRLIVTTGAVNASIDMQAAAEIGIRVCGTRSIPHATSELTWALILALVRRIPQESAAMRAGQWQTGVGGKLLGDTLAILGPGRIGARVAQIGKAFGMKVIGWSQNLTPERAESIGVELVSKAQLFERADVLTIHLALSDRTRGIVSTAEFARMKPSAYLVNTARGPIIDEAALVEALRDGRIAGAAIDVFEHEPLPMDHPLRTLERVLLTPHIGYVTEETYRAYFPDVVEDICSWLEGGAVRPLNEPAQAR